MRSLFLLISLAFLTAFQPASEKPEGRFLQRSAKLGEPVQYVLVFKHAAALEVVFPDSAYGFAPFEFIKKESFPTRTSNAFSTDSAIYHLRTFHLAPQQQLNVPVLLLQQQDTVALYGKGASLKLTEVVKAVPDPLVFREELKLVPLAEKFNYPYWLAGAGVFLLLAGGAWFVFRKNILMRYRLYVLNKKHTYFINRYNTFIERFHKSASLGNMEKAIVLWKNYLTDLEDTAVNSFTTKEIVNFYDNDEDVTSALKLFDRAIYGNILSENVSDTLTAFYLLHHFADRRYEIIKERTRNAATA